MTAALIPWEEIDTILLDMDGTLLDLNFDNHVWNSALPRAFAEKHNVGFENAASTLVNHMREIMGTIEFYNFDYWSEYTQLDITDLHRQYRDLVKYRPGAEAFLRWAKEANKTTILATNAHPESIKIKDEVVRISEMVDHVISSHQYDYPKETPNFWTQLKKELDFDEARSVFIDDNAPVLESSENFGIVYNLTISTPDSKKPKKTGLSFPAFNHFSEICHYIDAAD